MAARHDDSRSSKSRTFFKSLSFRRDISPLFDLHRRLHSFLVLGVMKHNRPVEDWVILQFKWKIEKKEKKSQKWGHKSTTAPITWLLLGDAWIIHTHGNIFLPLSCLFFVPFFRLPSCVFHLSFVLNSSASPPPSPHVYLRKPRYSAADLDTTTISQTQAHDYDAAGSVQLHNQSFRH